MNQPTPADARRTHDLGFSDEGPGDVATLRRLLAESEARNATLHQAVSDIGALVFRRPQKGRMAAIQAIVVAALMPKEEDHNDRH